MKIAIGVALLLFCVSGFMIVAKRQKSGTIEASKAPQEVKIVNDLKAVQIENLNVNNGVATFEVVNTSTEPLTALVIHSGRYQVMLETSRFDTAVESGQKRSFTLSIDGAQPLTVDALAYKSGKAEGDPTTIEKIEGTRKGYNAAIRMILEGRSDRSLAELKAAANDLQVTEDKFPLSAYSGAVDARQDVLNRLSEIESLTDQAKADGRMRDLNNWLRARTK
jgi:hypothetical protein